LTRLDELVRGLKSCVKFGQVKNPIKPVVKGDGDILRKIKLLNARCMLVKPNTTGLVLLTKQKETE